MSDYTPTTGEVKNGFIEFENAFRDLDEVESGFNRWLAEVKAQVWEEGYNAKWAETWFEDNPYRQGENK